MRRLIVLILATFITLGAALFCLKTLEGLDVALVTFNSLPTWNDRNALGRTVKNSETAMFTRRENVPVTSEFGGYYFPAVYTCSGEFFELTGISRVSGRLLWDSDSENLAKFAVIDENLAAALFANKGCTGERITVGGQEFAVVGVCSAEDGIFSAVDEYAVYLPVDTQIMGSAHGGAILRAEDDIALAIALKNGIAIAGGTKSADNIKVRAAMWTMPAKLMFFALWVASAVMALFLALDYAKKFAVSAKTELESSYIRGYLKKHWIAVLMHILGLFVAIAAFWAGFMLVRFDFVLDADLIPRSLIDLGAWVQNLGLYLRERNAAQAVPLSMATKPVAYGILATICATGAVTSALALLRRAAKWVRAKM